MKITKRTISDGIGGLAFIFFLVWIYCVFKPVDKMPLLTMYEDSFWILFFLAAVIGIVWLCFQIKAKPKRCNYLQDWVISDDRMSCGCYGLMQVMLGMCILAIVIWVYPSREIFYLWIILAVLVLYRGLKFIYAVAIY